MEYRFHPLPLIDEQKSQRNKVLVSPELDEQKQVFLPWNGDQTNQQDMPTPYRREDASLKI
ncbi:MAG: hypothetical protein ABI618_16165 [Nitrospirota bacterium]